MAVTKGQLTYDAEGMEGGRYHSRTLHVPSASSGLTIGRGYDMKEKEAAKIKADMLAAGVDASHAATLAQAAHLSGNEAKQFIKDHDLSHFEISMDTQEKLFASIYAELSKDVQRICNKADCVAAYGAVNWDTLHDKIKNVLVDLRFRGDYTGRTRRLMQRFVASNDLASFTAALSKRNDWSSVPEDRFNRRVKYLKQIKSSTTTQTSVSSDTSKPNEDQTLMQGQLTYDAEGMEGGRYHSRTLHVPSASSGLTVGRGYDMKEKTSAKIKADMLAAGVDANHAETLAQAAHLSGNEAKQFIKDHDLSHFEISMDTQEKLFASIYAELSKDVQRICNKADCVAAYGAVDWDTLHDKIKNVLVDLRFRGDYTGRTRRLMQRFAASNDLASFTAALIKRSDWSSVPEDRFNRRVKYLNTST